MQHRLSGNLLSRLSLDNGLILYVQIFKGFMMLMSLWMICSHTEYSIAENIALWDKVLASCWQLKHQSLLPHIYGMFNIHLPLLAYSPNFLLQVIQVTEYGIVLCANVFRYTILQLTGTKIP